MVTNKQKTSEEESLYERLRDHYTAGGRYDLPRRKELIEILELRYTPEEAQLALSIPVLGQGRRSLEQLAEKTGKGQAEVQSMLESLLSKGLLYMECSRDEGQEVYSLWGLMYSLYTPLFGDGLIDDTKRKVTELREKLWQAGLPYLQNLFAFSSRVMPYEPGIDPSAQVAPYERYSYYVNNAKAICVVACGCRMSVDRCKAPVYTCMHFDRQVEYWIKYRRGRALTKGEALQVIENAVKAGLVIIGSNDQEMPFVFCHCCRDCCVVLRPYIENFIPSAVAKSNFMPYWDVEKCRVCSTCQKACPVGAIGRHLALNEDERDHMIVVAERCIGCGVCTAVCPREAISLKRVREVVPAPTRRQFVAEYQAKHI